MQNAARMSAPNDDRRQATRKVLRAKVQLLLRNSLLLDARALNLSISGMAIAADGPIAPGTAVALRCFLPLGGSKMELLTQARVVHSVFSNAEGGFAIGLVFVDLSAEATGLIARVLSASP